MKVVLCKCALTWLLKWPLSPKILSGPQSCSQVAKVDTPLQIISSKWCWVLFVSKDKWSWGYKWLFATFGTTLYILVYPLLLLQNHLVFATYAMVRSPRTVTKTARYSDKIPRSRRIEQKAMESILQTYIRSVFQVAIRSGVQVAIRFLQTQIELEGDLNQNH